MGCSSWRRSPARNPPNRRGTDPYARWCGRGGIARCPPIPIYGLTPVRFTVVGSNPPEASSDRIELAFRAPCDGIGDPAVDVGLMPASPVGADFELSGERALGYLAVDGGSGQPGPGKDSSQTDDTVWFAHGRAASCWLFLTASETRQASV